MRKQKVIIRNREKKTTIRQTPDNGVTVHNLKY